MLEATKEFVIAAEISSKDQLLSSFQPIEFDVALIELTIFRSISSAQLLSILESKPHVKLLVHTYGDDIALGVEAIKSGALGFLAKQCSPDDLKNAIVSLHNGRPFITELISEALAVKLVFPGNILHSSLTVRELQVFKMLAIGINISGIAMQLGLSTKTVSTYKARILDKMDLPGVSELVRYAIFHNLLSPPLADQKDCHP